MNILGLSVFTRDSAACLLQDGKCVCAVQEKQFSRRKQDASFPQNAIDYCLIRGGLEEKNPDFVVLDNKPLLKFERLQETYLAYAPFGVRAFMETMPRWIKEELRLNELAGEALKLERNILFAERHEAYAAALFFPSPFREAAFLIVDGEGEWATASFGAGKDNHIQIEAQMHFPHSLGMVYAALARCLGFDVNFDDRGMKELMLHGEPRYKELILSELMDVKEDGSFKLNMKYFNCHTGTIAANKRFAGLLGGPPREEGTAVTRRGMDWACSFQEAVEEVIGRMIRHVHKKTGCQNLCFVTSGVLSCVRTERILREGPFENVWIQPVEESVRGAMGAALCVWHQYLGNERLPGGKNDFMAAEEREIDDYLVKNNIPSGALGRGEPKDGEVSRNDLRKFGLTFGIVLGVWGGLFLWRGRDYCFCFFILSAMFLFLGLAIPVLLKPIYRGWMALTSFVGRLTAQITLGGVFYLAFTPIGLLARLFGKDFLNLKFDREQESYWIDKKEIESGKNKYERQF